MSYLAVLNCRHVMMYAPMPKVGDVLWCRDCTDYRSCRRVEKAWKMNCRTCSLSHQYGVDEARIRRTAIRHLRLNPGHDVWITGGSDVEELLDSGQDQLPIVT